MLFSVPVDINGLLFYAFQPQHSQKGGSGNDSQSRGQILRIVIDLQTVEQAETIIPMGLQASVKLHVLEPKVSR